jgi:PAS domain S-box-containing protein
LLKLFRKSAPPPPRDRDGRYRAADEQAPLGVAFVDREGGWLQVNDRFAEISGYTREQLRRVTFHEMTHPDDAKRESSFLRRLRAGDIRRCRFEKRIVDRRGRVREVVVAASLVRDGASEFFLVVLDDAPSPAAEKPLQISVNANAQAFAEQARANAEQRGQELRRTIGELGGELARRDALLEEKSREMRILTRALQKEIERRKAAEETLKLLKAVEEITHVADALEAEIEIPPPPPPRPRGHDLFVASPVARRFHRLSCGSARRLDEETRIMFTSVDDAANAGYAACRLCAG